MKENRPVEIHGDVGQVFAGPVTQTTHKHFWTSGYPPGGVEAVPWWEDASDEDLRAVLQAERKIFKRAWLRFWFNVPSMLMAILMLCLVAKLGFSILHLGLITAGAGIEWWFIAGIGVALFPLGIWMSNVRRIEGLVAQGAQEKIDFIQTVLVRRRRSRR